MRVAFPSNALPSSLLALSLVGVACSREEAQEVTQPASQSAPVPAGNEGHDYVCTDGFEFNVRIDRGNAVVSAGGRSLSLAPVPGGTRADYAGEGVTVMMHGHEVAYMEDGAATRNCTAR